MYLNANFIYSYLFISLISLSSFTFPAGTIWLLYIEESNVKSGISAILLESNILSKLFVNSSSSSIYCVAN